VIGACALLLVSCAPAGSASQSLTTAATPSSAASGTIVDVTLKEVAITVSGPASHGAITFRVNQPGHYALGMRLDYVVR
jgi:sarcosine oxidase gamma subunit